MYVCVYMCVCVCVCVSYLHLQSIELLKLMTSSLSTKVF